MMASGKFFTSANKNPTQAQVSPWDSFSKMENPFLETFGLLFRERTNASNCELPPANFLWSFHSQLTYFYNRVII